MDRNEAHILARIEEDHIELKKRMLALVADMDRVVEPEAFTIWKLDFLWSWEKWPYCC